MRQIYTRYVIEINESQNLERVSLWGDLVKIEPIYTKDNILMLVNIYDLNDHLIGSINCYKAKLTEIKYYYDERGDIIYLDKEV